MSFDIKHIRDSTDLYTGPQHGPIYRSMVRSTLQMSFDIKHIRDSMDLYIGPQHGPIYRSMVRSTLLWDVKGEAVCPVCSPPSPPPCNRCVRYGGQTHRAQ